MTIIHTLNKKIHCNHYLTHVKTNTSKTCNPNHNILLAFKYQCETRTGEEKKKKKKKLSWRESHSLTGSCNY